MKIRRTANAGVLLTLDGKTVLLDGVCGKVSPYLATPAEEMVRLAGQWPDLMAFTHCHEDHLDLSAAARFLRETGRPVMGTAEMAKALGNSVVQTQKTTLGTLQIIPYATRHLGGVGKDLHHVSFVIEGSLRVWFAGDASPVSMKICLDRGAPDVLVVPFAYVSTEAAWQGVAKLNPKTVVVVHMPDRNDDPYGLWSMVESVVNHHPEILVWIPEIGESRSWDGHQWKLENV